MRPNKSSPDLTICCNFWPVSLGDLSPFMKKGLSCITYGMIIGMYIGIVHSRKKIKPV